jgi:predicted CoA-binding protein
MKEDTTIETMVQSFLAQKTIAVVGVSGKRDTGCNLNYKRFKDNGYRVYAVNPHMSTYDGAPCYPDLQSIPEKPAAVFLFTNPGVTEQMVQQCVNLRIKHIWMHCLLGTKPGLGAGKTSVSPAAVELCKANGIAVIPGSCPAQFLAPDFAHGLMRRLWKAFGFLQVSGWNISNGNDA